MKFKIILLYFFCILALPDRCKQNKSTFIPYISKGFALVYDEKRLCKKIVSRKLNQDELQVAHNRLRANSIVTITNPENKKSLTLKCLKN
jgi:rare lipoprotein A (peptidoglycan hydrolase)